MGLTMTRKRATKQETAERLLAVEELLTRGLSVRRIVRELGAKWSLSEQQVRHYIDAVRRVWAKEADGIDRTHLKAQHRERLVKVYERAMTRRAFARDDEGNVVLRVTGQDPDTGEPTREPVTIESPDLRSATKALDSLAKLDNLNDEVVRLEGADNLVDLLRLAAVRREKEKLHGVKMGGSRVEPDPPAAEGAG